MYTVEELINHLKQFPRHAPVKLSVYGCGCTVESDYDPRRIKMQDHKVVIEAEDN